ncbi:MAG TPA: hypothetical protein VNU19_15580 [Candidatus Acidoferrum sp.]|jgi:hypothetical protein|nr:hypothetical protein [Candidatus Acidoferrum sp.]
MPVPTIVQSAQTELLSYAENIRAERGASLGAAYELARLLRPDLAGVLDEHGVTQPREMLMSEPSKSTSSPHEQLLILADQYQQVHPGTTKEIAYQQVWQEHPEVVELLAVEQYAEQREMNLDLAERSRSGPGSQPGFNANPGTTRGTQSYNQSPGKLTRTISGDQAAHPQHTEWMKRAQELLKAGRAPTLEQAYVMAMENR